MITNFFTLAYLNYDSPDIMRDEIMWHSNDSSCSHYHDFFLITLIIRGNMSYETPNFNTILDEGTLIIIRPGEIHYKKSLDEDILAHHWGFSSSMMHSIFQYLCSQDKLEWLLQQGENPPLIHLDIATLRYFDQKLGNISSMFSRSEPYAIFELKMVLMEIMARFLPAFSVRQKSPVPPWLEKLVISMNEKENFVEGMDAMLEISQKSSAYLSRMFKKHYHTTPTKFITSLRLNYAAQMLLNSDWNILKISIESGFESLSNFYHCFSEVFHMSPKKYRSTHGMICCSSWPSSLKDKE